MYVEGQAIELWGMGVIGETLRPLASQPTSGHNRPMRCRLGLSLLLAAPLACFSEPPGSPSASSGSTSAAGTEQGGDSSGSSETSESEGNTSDGTTTGVTSVGVTTDFTTGATTTGFAETEGVKVEVLFDFYASSCQGMWNTPAFEIPEPVPCDLTPGLANVEGGVWRYPTFDTPQFPDESQVLILRPFPEDGEAIEGRFSANDLPFGEGATLALGWEFVNTAGPEADSRMSFQLLVLRPDGTRGPAIVSAINRGIGESDTVNIPMSDLVMGPMDELYFFVLSDTYVGGQGVALYSAVIYDEP